MNERLRSLGRRSVLRTAVGRRFYHALRDYKRWTLVKKWRRERTAPIQAYLRTHVVRKLQIGAGENVLPGWLNSDIRPLNSNVLFLDAKEPSHLRIALLTISFPSISLNTYPTLRVNRRCESAIGF